MAIENLEIGTIENKENKLEPKKVKIIDIDEETVNNKNGEEIGKKYVFKCKHPEREELIDISKVKYEKDGKLKIEGTWKTLDKENKIAKQSAIAQFMKSQRILRLKDFIEKEIETCYDDKEYLVFKAY